MKIALLSYNIGHGGKTSHLIELSKKLIEKKHQVFIITTGVYSSSDKIENDKIKEFKSIGCKVLEIKRSKTINTPFISKISIVFFMIKLELLLRFYGINICHVHDNSFAPILAKMHRKFVRTQHMGFDIERNEPVRAFHEIAISTKMLHDFKKKIAYNNNEISLIFNGVNKDFAKVATVRDKELIKIEKGVPSDKIIIGIIGNLTAVKGHDILFEAISNISDSLRSNIHLVIIGRTRSSANVEWFDRLLNKHEDIGNLISLFEFSKTKPFYDIIDVLVSASRSESFSLVTIEGMLSGCCVVRSDTGGAKDQIVNNETGFIFPNEDSHSLKVILEQLIINNELRKQIAQNGRTYALNNFTSDIMVESTIKVYEKF